MAEQGRPKLKQVSTIQYNVRYQLNTLDAGWRQHKKPYMLIASRERQAFIVKPKEADLKFPSTAHSWYRTHGPCFAVPWGPRRIWMNPTMVRSSFVGQTATASASSPRSPWGGTRAARYISFI